MAWFAFEARDGSGALRTGRREGRDASAVALDLSGSGWTPVRITEEKEGQQAAGAAARRKRRKVTLDELILFSRQMTSLTRAGISVSRAVGGLSESAKNPDFQEVLSEIADALGSGVNVATAFQRHDDVFSKLYVSLIHIGENTGRLDEVFQQIAQYLELERETLRRIKSATRYPTFVIGSIVAALFALNVFVIPVFAQVFEKFNADLPWQTRVLLDMSAFFEAYWWLIVSAAVAAWAGMKVYVSTPEGRLKWDAVKLRLPLTGSVINRVILARFCQTFAMVYRAGVPINSGLQIVANALSNAFLASRTERMREAIERGTSVIQAARESEMFTPVILQMIAVGEETGSLDELMDQAAGFYEEEVDYQLKRLTDAIEPILIIAIGGMVLVLALGVFLPLWDLSAAAKR